MKGGVPYQPFSPNCRRLALPIHLLGPSSAGIGRSSLAPLLCCIGPVAGDVALQDRGVVDNRVGGRGGCHEVGQYAFPLREDQVGRDAQVLEQDGEIELKGDFGRRELVEDATGELAGLRFLVNGLLRLTLRIPIAVRGKLQLNVHVFTSWVDFGMRSWRGLALLRAPRGQAEELCFCIEDYGIPTLSFNRTAFECVKEAAAGRGTCAVMLDRWEPADDGGGIQATEWRS